METLEKIGEFCKHIAIPVLLAVILGGFVLSSIPVKAEVPAEYPPVLIQETTMVVLLSNDGTVNTAKVNEDGTLSYYEMAGKHVEQYRLAIRAFFFDAGTKYDAWIADMENQRTKVEAVEADPKT